MEANEYLLSHKDDDNNTPPSSGNPKDDASSKEDTNKGTLTLDATCAPANIRYPQDVSPLNEEKNWKQLFTDSANPIACHYRDVTEDAPEKTILPLQKAKNTMQRKSGKHSANSLVSKRLICPRIAPLKNSCHNRSI